MFQKIGPVAWVFELFKTIKEERLDLCPDLQKFTYHVHDSVGMIFVYNCGECIYYLGSKENILIMLLVLFLIK